MVRTEVVRQGYRPDILAYDADSWVRKTVAEEEHCPEDVLIELVNDEDDCVRDAAYRKM